MWGKNPFLVKFWSLIRGMRPERWAPTHAYAINLLRLRPSKQDISHQLRRESLCSPHRHFSITSPLRSEPASVGTVSGTVPGTSSWPSRGRLPSGLFSCMTDLIPVVPFFWWGSSSVYDSFRDEVRHGTGTPRCLRQMGVYVHHPTGGPRSLPSKL